MMDIVDELMTATSERCPFDKDMPDIKIEPHEPCPICGMTGLDNAEDKCVGSPVLLMRRAAAEIKNLRAINGK